MLDFDEIFETLLKKVRLLNGKGVTFFGQFFLKYWDRKKSIITNELINTFENC